MEDDRAPYGGDTGRGGMDDYNSPGGYGGGMAGERSMSGGFGNQPDDIDDLPF